MDKPFKFALPPPNFNKSAKDALKPKPHFLTPSGMSLLPREKQPPPMYGKHGATVPPRYLKQHVNDQQVANAINSTLESPAPPEKQYCEACELELNSFEDLKRHRGQHEKCPVDGCLYRGHPTVMDKHINALHSSGLFDKFKKLSTPEEIAAWREERRKRYPTVANVLLKQKAQDQRQKRGERLEANKNRFGKVNDRKRAQPNTKDEKNTTGDIKPREENKPNNKKNKNKKNKRKQKDKNQELTPKVQQNDMLTKGKLEEEEVDITCGGIKMFKGTSQLKDYKHLNDNKKIISNNNALFGLVGMYGSDDDSQDNESDEGDMDIDLKVVNAEEHDTSQCNEIPKEGKSKANKNDEVSDSLNKSIVGETASATVNEVLDKMDEEENLQNYNNSNDNSIHSKLEGSILITSSSKASNGLENETLSSNLNENSSDEAPEEAPIQRSSIALPPKLEDKAKTESSEEPAAKRAKVVEQNPTPKPKHLLKRKSGLDYRKARLRKQNTLLEKLLEVDIRHERNVLLQCVRYVCENNFFGIGQNSQEKPG